MSEPIVSELGAEPTSPAAARRFATQALTTLLAGAAPRELCENVELVVSELVTNAVRAQSPTVGVTVAREHRRILVEVRDEAVGWPEPRDAGVHDVTGRGLALVSAVCESWGVRLDGTGKVVWAAVPIQDAPA